MRFFEQANKTEVQGFKTPKTFAQQHKRAVTEATLHLSSQRNLVFPLGNFREWMYKLTYCKMLQIAFS